MFSVINFLLYVSFLLSIFVQYNDPDPFEWMAVYAGAALACVLAAARRLPVWYPVVLGLAVAVWAGILLVQAMGSTQELSWAAVFGSAAMKNERVELVRETGGLLIVGLWSVILVVRQSRLSRE